MLESVIQDLIKNQRPYYLPQCEAIKGISQQYWLVFKHRDADNLFKNVLTFFTKHDPTYKLMRIDLNTAHIFEYIPKKDKSIPTTTLLRTSGLPIIEKFLNINNAYPEPDLLRGTFKELESQFQRKRKFNLPTEIDQYNKFIGAYLERTKIYRRSTAYFNSGVLKLYEEPLASLARNEGTIRLLMDWQGFTSKRDAQALEKLHNPEFRREYISQTLSEFLQGLTDKHFHSTTILADMVRFEILTIKMIKMDGNRGIYHKKTGILTDNVNNSISHEGSDNFTRSAHGTNAESVVFLYSSDDLDRPDVERSIQEFDEEWQNTESTFDLTQEFLQKVIEEKERRQNQQPQIHAVNPDELIAGETNEIEITGDNLDQVESITIIDQTPVEIEQQTKEKITGTITPPPNHPPSSTEFIVKGKRDLNPYRVTPKQPVAIAQKQEIPDFPEIIGFKEAIEKILAGKYGTPQDFSYWLAKQIPLIERIPSSALFEKLQQEGILFEHQKSGAQHCIATMKTFGVAVCADAVGLGKTRLAAAVVKYYISEKPQTKVAIIAAKKLQDNWIRELGELDLINETHYYLYNKNLMSRKNSGFLDDFSRYGGADLVIIDEAHEGIRNYRNRIHQTCLDIKYKDQISGRKRDYLLLTATPWNNRRNDIYNILSPFLSRPQGFIEFGFPQQVKDWFEKRESGEENFTQETDIFRRVYRELFKQRTRKMLRESTPDLQVYPKRIAEWLPIEFEPSTENALEEIFSQFEDSLYIPFSDPIRYFSTNDVSQRSLLRNQRRMFLQRAESSMYALRRTIQNFGDRIRAMQEVLEQITPNAEGLEDFLLGHYNFAATKIPTEIDYSNINGFDDFFEEEDDEDEDEAQQAESRQQLRTMIDDAIKHIRADSEKGKEIHQRILGDCESDLSRLERINQLLAEEFVRDHKRQEVMLKVQELVQQGHKVLLISTFSDTVIDYYYYFKQNPIIQTSGIGMAMGSRKVYYPYDDHPQKPTIISQHNICKGIHEKTSLKRLELFRFFAPDASCRKPEDKPRREQEISVLIGSETLSVGQNLQDADYLINIDLPWNPMTLEQRIGRIDRPKSQPCDYIYIYYANSESQLLRQASRLKNLNKKLIGDHAQEGDIPNTIESVNDLNASVYGDTLFDDEILPGYLDFIDSLVKARQDNRTEIEQENLQEKAYESQETSQSVYSQNEILFAEELRKCLDEQGRDYPVNPITIGAADSEELSPKSVIAFELDYFDPNGKLIPERSELIYWNDFTLERDGLGQAIATSFKTAEFAHLLSTQQFLEQATNLYNQLVTIKNRRAKVLSQIDTAETIEVNTERLTSIQNRIKTIMRNVQSLPDSIDRRQLKEAIRKLNQSRDMKNVQTLLKDFTTGHASKLPEQQFIETLMIETDKLNLLDINTAQPHSVNLSVKAMLLKL
jgi:superfamily II DNA or RNA helicase